MDDLALEISQLSNTPARLINWENPPVIIRLADDGIYYWEYEEDLSQDIDELETISYVPEMWQGPGWYKYRFDLTDQPVPEAQLVEFLGRGLSPEIIIQSVLTN